jgi:hypothetical protein
MANGKRTLTNKEKMLGLENSQTAFQEFASLKIIYRKTKKNFV